jgi:hypothetical protein
MDKVGLECVAACDIQRVEFDVFVKQGRRATPRDRLLPTSKAATLARRRCGVVGSRLSARSDSTSTSPN